MRIEQKLFYIVASNVLDSNKSRVISKITDSFDTDEPDINSININTKEFLGKGYGIYLTNKLESTDESIDDLGSWLIYANLDGEQLPFQIIRTIEELYLVEGTLIPGIYNAGNDFKYYEIEDIDILSYLLMHLVIGTDLENQKLFCSENGYEVRAIDTDQTIYRVERHPSSFFDIHCPFCNQKVVTHETDPNYYDCVIVTNSCAHYVGKITSESGIFMKNSFETSKESYEILDNDLSLRIDREIVKPFVLTPALNSSGSYWNKDSENDNYVEHFLFLYPR